ncbi:dihydrofolate reductase family protein [Planctomonas psychrotolerans]|uniref:dihydrofolate reductase family protein n=1 Tax=Planctomonas psychrotolerans TaxID=2528712 RepID=UPI00123A9507|nr:dihydrofolate reductase family protein [Planctomonas psychrotolerans]
MIVSRVHPAPRESRDTDDPDTTGWLSENYRPDRPDWLRINLIGSANGSATGSDGTSETLSSRTDRRILGVIRDHSDVVLVGASSVRTEGYVLPRSAALAVVTRTGDLSGAKLTRDGSRGPLLVLCPRSVEGGVRRRLGDLDARLLPVDDTDGSLSPTDMIAALRAEGLRSVVCEGGPTLAAALLRASVVDELCLSVSPALVAPGVSLLPPDVDLDVPLELRQLLLDGADTCYFRWSVPASTSASARPATRADASN